MEIDLWTDVYTGPLKHLLQLLVGLQMQSRTQQRMRQLQHRPDTTRSSRVKSSSRYVKGTLMDPGMCPGLQLGRGSASTPSNLPTPRASMTCAMRLEEAGALASPELKASELSIPQV